MIALLVTVRGRVQGVGFRWHTMRRAEDLGVRGWVRNMKDRSVQAHLEGDPAAVESLLEWLARGPAHASVDQIDDVAVTPIGAGSFSITG